MADETLSTSKTPAKKKVTKKKATKKQRAKKKASSKKTANKKKANKKKASRGAKASGWIHVTLEEIGRFRQDQGLSEVATAKALGVSLGSLRNWTKSGKTASLKMQKLVRTAIDGYVGSPAGGSSAAPTKSLKKVVRSKKTSGVSGDLAPVVGLLENALTYEDYRPFVEAALVLLRAR
tara:strand:- start:9616 stop:10149 length:534 start_codon:yes stop_codon:yes gene_type:complete